MLTDSKGEHYVESAVRGAYQDTIGRAADTPGGIKPFEFEDGSRQTLERANEEPSRSVDTGNRTIRTATQMAFKETAGRVARSITENNDERSGVGADALDDSLGSTGELEARTRDQEATRKLAPRRYASPSFSDDSPSPDPREAQSLTPSTPASTNAISGKLSGSATLQQADHDSRADSDAGRSAENEASHHESSEACESRASMEVASSPIPSASDGSSPPAAPDASRANSPAASDQELSDHDSPGPMTHSPPTGTAPPLNNSGEAASRGRDANRESAVSEVPPPSVTAVQPTTPSRAPVLAPRGASVDAVESFSRDFGAYQAYVGAGKDLIDALGLEKAAEIVRTTIPLRVENLTPDRLQSAAAMLKGVLEMHTPKDMSALRGSESSGPREASREQVQRRNLA